MTNKEKILMLIDEIIKEAQEEPQWKAESALKCLKKELLKAQEAVEPREQVPTCPLKEQEESVPLKPLAKWMAKYAYCYGLSIYTDPKITEDKRQTTLAEAWEEVFRSMRWEDADD